MSSRDAAGVQRLGRADARERRQDAHSERYKELSKQSIVAPFVFRTSTTDLFQKILIRRCLPDPGPRPPGVDPDLRWLVRRGNSMFGKLTWDAIPLDQPIPLIAGVFVVVVILVVIALIAIKGWGPYLWREWITSVDHKHIGVMYVFLAAVMLLRGFVDAIMMRSQQALAFQSQGICRRTTTIRFFPRTAR